ncbi:MAG: ABC transporter permease [Planctomycetota bacterium]
MPIPEERFWAFGVLVVMLLVVVPLGAVMLTAFFEDDNAGAWMHLVETGLLLRYSLNTAILACAVTLAATILGAGPAWLLTAYRFPGSRLLPWAMLLPLAVPAYISAYAYTDLLQFSGPLRTMLRDTFGPNACAWMIEPRSIAGASAVLAFALSPYVFVAARQAFVAHATYSTSIARTLGRGPVNSFLTVALPLASPAILGGAALVLMETIADFGVADYCAVDTLATGVYRAWLGLDSPAAAARLSLVLLIIVLTLITAVHIARSRTAVPHAAATAPAEPLRLVGLRGLLATLACTVPVILGFIAPTVVLIFLAVNVRSDDATRAIVTNTLNTMSLSSFAAVIAVALGLITVYGRRVHPTPIVRGAAKLTLLGYAIPGTVIAVGVLIPLAAFDHQLNSAVAAIFGDDVRPGLLLTGSIIAITIGCQTRFLAVAVSTVDAAFLRVRPIVDHAARTLGAGPTATLCRVHLPICRAGLLTAGLLVFADVAKELPMTLLLRPFDFDTLAVRAYQFASEERLREAAVPALSVIGVGLLPVLVLAILSRSTVLNHEAPQVDGKTGS